MSILFIILLLITVFILYIFFTRDFIKKERYSPELNKIIKNNIKHIEIHSNWRPKIWPQTNRNYCRCSINDPNKQEIIDHINIYLNSNKQTIPKIIHQIWIGNNPPPYEWINSFKIDLTRKYPDWKYYLWTESNIPKLTYINRDIYYQEKSYNGKSDILRYYLLYKYGGIYIDADSKWFGKDLGELINKTNETGIFIAKENEKKFKTGLASGVIGSSKKNPIMLYALYTMNKLFPICKKVPAYKSIGPFFCDQVFLDFNVTIFPSHYFYPVWWVGLKGDQNFNKKDYPNSYMCQYGYTTNSLHKRNKLPK